MSRWIVAVAPVAAALNSALLRMDPTVVSNAMTGERIKWYGSEHNHVRVACIGDSITWGMGAVPHGQASYPQLLQERLGDDFEVINFGHSSRALIKDADTPYWDVDEHRWALASDADVVVIMLGTNDARNANSHKIVDHYVQDYLDFIRGVRNMASKPEVFVVAPPPVVKGALWESWNKTAQNKMVPGLVKKVAKQAQVNFIDVHSVFHEHCGSSKSPCDWISDDGVHPVEEGYEAIAIAVHAAIGKSCAERLEELRLKDHPGHEVQLSRLKHQRNQVQMARQKHHHQNKVQMLRQKNHHPIKVKMLQQRHRRRDEIQ